MALFYQHNINHATRLGVWHITEQEDFFLQEVSLQRTITHPHKRLQHLAGRYLLRWLFPEFPHHLIAIADTRKPYLPDEQYHFSISHCGDYAAAIVSRTHRVGIDIELPAEKVSRVKEKFLHPGELLAIERLSDRPMPFVPGDPLIRGLTLLWSAKEAVFKWYGEGEVDFSEHIRLQVSDTLISERGQLQGGFYKKTPVSLMLSYINFAQLTLAWVQS